MLALLAFEADEGGLGLFEFGFEIADATTDKGWVDAGLDGGELAFEAFVDGGDLVLKALAFRTVVVAEFACEQLVLVAEGGEPLRSEDAGREEAVDELDQQEMR